MNVLEYRYIWDYPLCPSMYEYSHSRQIYVDSLCKQGGEKLVERWQQAKIDGKLSVFYKEESQP